MGLQPLAQKAWNASHCAFGRNSRKDRNYTPYLRQQIFRERTADNLDIAQLLLRKQPGEDASVLSFALRGMQFHDEFVACGQRQLSMQRKNIAVKTFGSTTMYPVEFGLPVFRGLNWIWKS